MNVLVASAHPDDEILGVGGTICRHISNGDDVYVCIITKTYEPEWSNEFRENKIQEQKEVDKLLGIKERFNLNYPTVKLNLVPHGELSQKITNIINQIKPEIVYTHFEDGINQDHSITFKACMVATRPPNKIKLLCYETISETEWSNKPFKPNIWVDIQNFLEKKIEAFEIYKSEVREEPHPRNRKGIKILAQKRGIEAGLSYAEAFVLIRQII